MLQESGSSFTQTEIAEAASLPPQTVNSALKKMEQQGLVTLERENGKIGKTIRLTSKGLSCVEEKIAPVMEAEEKVCATFTDEETETFLRLLKSLTMRLDEEINGAQ